MKGSGPPPTYSESTVLQTSLRRLRLYDRQRVGWLDTIGRILKKTHSLKHQLKAEVSSEWFQKYFSSSGAKKEMIQLTQYYRYYRNSPLLVCSSYQPIMSHYWHKSKTLYYRKIKRELQLTEGTDENTDEAHIESSREKTSQIKTTFQLPSQLQRSQLQDIHDPDATLRKLILALDDNKFKEETREGSNILPSKRQQLTIKVHTPQEGTIKSHTKSHLRTNPSQLGSTNSVKKTKKRMQHQSLSNEPRRFSPHCYKEQKINTMGSCQKMKNMELNLNYQRKNRTQKVSHILKGSINHNSQITVFCPSTASHKQSKGKEQKILQKSQKDIHIKHPKEKESSVKKEREKLREKSNPQANRKESTGKCRERQQNTKVKAAIDRAKDKIKEEKKEVLKKYLQYRQSCNKSSESKPSDNRKTSNRKIPHNM